MTTFLDPKTPAKQENNYKNKNYYNLAHKGSALSLRN